MEAAAQEVFPRRRAAFVDNLRRSARAILDSLIGICPPHSSGAAAQAPAGAALQDELLVSGVNPVPGVTTDELLRVAAAAQSFSDEPEGKAIVRQAEALGLSLPDAEDFRHLPSGGIHCWVDGIPTLLGSRTFVTGLGIAVAEPVSPSCSCNQVFVAQGSRLLGSVQIYHPSLADSED